MFLCKNNYIFQFLNYGIISLIKARSVMTSTETQLVACLPVVQATQIQFQLIPSFFIFWNHVYNGLGGHNVYFLASAFLFSFFGISHARMRTAELASHCERLKLYQYFTTVKLYTLLE
jgi:hypothetical protein